MEDVDEEIVRRINDEKVKRGIAIMRCKSKLHIRNINQERTKTGKYFFLNPKVSIRLLVLQVCVFLISKRESGSFKDKTRRN